MQGEMIHGGSNHPGNWLKQMSGSVRIPWNTHLIPSNPIYIAYIDDQHPAFWAGATNLLQLWHGHTLLAANDVQWTG